MPSGFGAYGGNEGRPGGVWAWPGKEGEAGPRELPSTEDAAYADSVPVAGVLNPQTHVPEADGAYFYWAQRSVWQWPANTVYRYLTSGAGGWGNPLERDSELVMRDVRDGYVTIDGAARDYGVIIVGDPEADPEGLRLDAGATAAARKRLAG